VPAFRPACLYLLRALLKYGLTVSRDKPKARDTSAVGSPWAFILRT
jgi:hypothetical protein